MKRQLNTPKHKSGVKFQKLDVNNLTKQKYQPTENNQDDEDDIEGEIIGLKAKKYDNEDEISDEELSDDEGDIYEEDKLFDVKKFNETKQHIKNSLKKEYKTDFQNKNDILFYLTSTVVEYNNGSVVKLYGVNEKNESIVLRIEDFSFYFYSREIVNGENKSINKLLSDLNGLNKKIEKTKTEVTKLEEVEKIEIISGLSNNLTKFTKIHVKNHLSIRAVSNILRKENFEIFEANVAPDIRFSVDNDIKPFAWYKISKQKCKKRNDRKETTDLEYTISYKDIEAQPQLKTEVGQMIIQSFDIECKSVNKKFPNAEKDSIIQIGNIFQLYGGDKKENIMLCLKECSPIEGKNIFCFEKESNLLRAFRSLMIDIDPTVITGYNITNFDFPYIITRCNALNLKSATILGRTKNIISKVALVNSFSKQRGHISTKKTNINGRIQFDMITYIKSETKQTSYSLNYVSDVYLGLKKADLPHYKITDNFDGKNSSPDTRSKIAKYCYIDCDLPLRLNDKLRAFMRVVQICNETSLDPNTLITSGQQKKGISLLLRTIHKLGYICRTNYNGQSEKFEGATVLDPITGFYVNPVAILDFTSLYPSIMMAFNLCYTTLLKDEDLAKYKEGDYITTPNGFHFLKEYPDSGHIKKEDLHLFKEDEYVILGEGENIKYFQKKCIKKGVLPIILRRLIDSRNEAKALLEIEKDPFTRNVLETLQIAIKVIANSIYGFTGAQVGFLPLLAISSSVTAIGRQSIEKTKRAIEENITKQKGYPFDIRILYGDTDSVMVEFLLDDFKTDEKNEEGETIGKRKLNRGEKIDLAFKYAPDIPLLIKDVFEGRLNLDFEKIFCPFLTLKKKRYVGLKWTPKNYLTTKKFDKLDIKGLQSVRRDNCDYVGKNQENILKMIIINEDIEGAKKYLDKEIKDLIHGKMDYFRLIKTGNIARKIEDYKSKSPHIILAEKMNRKNPGSANIGDRISYIIRQGEDKEKTIKDLAIRPAEASKDNIAYSTSHYLGLLKKSLKSILPYFMDEYEVERMFSQTRSEKSVKRGGIARKLVFSKKCSVCKTTTNNETSLCDEHNTKDNLKQQILCKSTDKLKLEEKNKIVWDNCVECMGSLQDAVECGNDECSKLYERTRTQQSVNEITKELKDLEDLLK